MQQALVPRAVLAGLHREDYRSIRAPLLAFTPLYGIVSGGYWTAARALRSQVVRFSMDVIDQCYICSLFPQIFRGWVNKDEFTDNPTCICV